MSLIRDLVIRKPENVVRLIQLERAKINLKALNKVTIQFDPFSNKIKDIRLFAFLIHSKVPFETNLKCIIKTEILQDRSDPQITFNLTDGKQFIFKCANLTCLEIFQLMNKYITPLAPVEDVAEQYSAKILKKK